MQFNFDLNKIENEDLLLLYNKVNEYIKNLTKEIDTSEVENRKDG